jgi:lysophospholipase L1-like esterase
VWFNADATLQRPTSDAGLVIYGDSILMGAAATRSTLEGWPVLLRAALDTTIAVEGWGYRSLWDDANTPELRTVLVQRLLALRPAAAVLAIGTNDYGLSRWRAAEYGAAYGALASDLLAARPGLILWCLTPIIRKDEGRNKLGDTLTNYRAAQEVAIAQVPGARTIDGTQILTLADLAEGTHPTTAGQAKYAQAMKMALEAR